MIEFLVSTTNRTDLHFLNKIFEHVKGDYSILVINQCIDIPVPDSIVSDKENVRVLSVSERGTSRSRNLAIQNAIGDICTFTDDDLIYSSDVLSVVQAAFSQIDSDIITFQTAICGSDVKMKSYRDTSFKHNKRTILAVGDWEIFFKKESIGSIRLDERFGLGCEFPACEYHIFLMDCYKEGLKIHYEPHAVVCHPFVITTGVKFLPYIEIARGAGFVRMLGIFGFPAAIYFAIKKYPIYKSKNSFFSEVGYLFTGCLKIYLYGLHKK